MSQDLTLYLLACSKTKAAEACQARDLYQGQLFKLCRAYVEKKGADYDYLILSAAWGVLQPGDVIEPYNRSCTEWNIATRSFWADHTWYYLKGLLLRPGVKAGPYQKVVFLAGQVYREFLAEKITRLGISVEVPMEGLGIGEQKAWLLQALRP